MSHTIRIGGTRPNGGRENRNTTVKVDGTYIKLYETLWEDEGDKFETENKWSIATRLHVSGECSTKEEVLTSASDIVKVVQALGVLGYELHSMEEEGVALWNRPAPDREES